MNTDNQWMESVMRCTQCLDMCLSVCPVYFVKKNQSVSPSHLAHIAGLVKKGLVQTSPEVIEMLINAWAAGYVKNGASMMTWICMIF